MDIFESNYLMNETFRKLQMKITNQVKEASHDESFMSRGRKEQQRKINIRKIYLKRMITIS